MDLLVKVVELLVLIVVPPIPACIPAAAERYVHSAAPAVGKGPRVALKAAAGARL